ncbi:GNAT family N-acetyltransferase [Paenibacillus sp. FSL W8-0426]|uniref:GNAT family N-acetyltransferase n=1 Tax=Paenibacillus sp. FSL W8-0426 TaxID=2921714 RepID=UPI0030DCFB74
MISAKEVEIVEYEPAFAASVAKMWNMSQDSWGGDSTVRTEEQIIKEHQNSPYLHVFLAMVDDEVVGYCSFSHYKEDQGALYIPLLNVRPDYHGRKVGKRLILRALDETIKRGWPRLDLYTWAGNTKAVPAYKKCGFFWERRDDTTHLMNLIPSVLQTEAVKHYFDELDWYADSLREIVISPDGRQERGFDYFTYEWSKGSTYLKMEYERTGRGLRLIETEDYLIEASIPEQHELPFGAHYPIMYKAVNKSGKPLTVDVQSVSNAGISFDLQESMNVEQTGTIEGTYFVQPVEEDQNPFETHPVVEAELRINGKQATFKIGIEPKYPVKIKFHAPQLPLHAGQTYNLDLTVENEYAADGVFEFELPSDGILAFVQPTVRIAVPAKGRQSIAVKAELLEYGIWHHKVGIYSITDSEKKRVHQQKTSIVFQGIHAAFGGETEQEWMISNGLYSVRLGKSQPMISIYGGNKDVISLGFPSFGLPYSDAFEKKRAARVAWRHEGAMIMEADYEIASFHLNLTLVVQLHNNGVISRHFIVRNSDAAPERTEPIYMKEKFHFGLEGAIIPYQGQYVDAGQSPDAADKDYWELTQFTENWLYAKQGDHTRGITWPEGRQLTRENWLYGLEHELGLLPAENVAQTEPIRIAVGTWQDWRDFRAFALKGEKDTDLHTTAHLELIVNDRNPFIHGEAAARIVERKNTLLAGEIHVSSVKEGIVPVSQLVYEEEQRTVVALPLNAKPALEADIVSVRLDMEDYEVKRHRAVFPVTGDGVILQTEPSEHGDLCMADNGVLRIKASSVYAPALFSLQYHGQEWLESSYPQAGPKSWWNPWTGGITAGIIGMSESSLMKEPREVSFAEMKDSAGNAWSGIRMTVKVTHHAKYKGITMHHYFLMLPGAPVLASVVGIVQHTGAPLHPLHLIHYTSCQASRDIKDCRVYVQDQSGEGVVYKAGRVQMEVNSASGIIQYGSREREQRLMTVSHPGLESVETVINNELSFSVNIEKLFVPDRQGKMGKPHFCIISDLPAMQDAYADLQALRFDDANLK